MLELALIDELLPEAKAMLTAGRRGLGELERVLPRLDRLVGEGRSLPDAALLAALLLPAVLLRRHELEAGRQRPLSGGALRRLILETTDAFFARFTVARQKTDEAVEALLAFHRLGEPDWSPVERARFARRPAFRNALVLFEILVEATGQGRDILDHWRLLAASVPEGPTPSPPRRRRRRRGRGRPAPGARRG
jgi:poly(A) polymerase